MNQVQRVRCLVERIESPNGPAAIVGIGLNVYPADHCIPRRPFVVQGKPPTLTQRPASATPNEPHSA